MKRRTLLKLTAGGLLLPSGLLARPEADNKKVVWIILRGALDSLHSVVPLGDAKLLDYRAEQLEPIHDALLPLDSDFALHPQLGTLHELYRKGQMLPVVATATPYRDRSHFSAQDILESGLVPASWDSGWMGRLADINQQALVAISKRRPLSIRGSHNSSTWFPDERPELSDDFYLRLQRLYAGTGTLEAVIDKALADDMAEATGGRDRARFENLATTAGNLLKDPAGPGCLMLELDGWDTHSGQASRLDRRLRLLDAGIKNLRTALDDEWDNTLVIVATEFGRTVAMNGTSGTDHGTAAALFLLGGKAGKPRVAGQWPGLNASALHQGRDLRPTSDIRAWIGGALQEHWQVDSERIFPGVKPRRA